MADSDPTAEEVQALLSAATSLPAPGTYHPMDRYRDFRAVFMGSEQGKRVLHEILAWGQMFASVPAVSADGRIDPFMSERKEGARSMAIRILTTINREPVEPPKQANSKRK